MKKSTTHRTVLALLMIVATATLSLAADQYQYQGKGTVHFDHKAHGEKLTCTACHQGEPARIAIENKDQGHGLCLACHKAESAKGQTGLPVKCNECHIK
ncbi:MAG: cytochrome c3 family protein [Desulfuromonadaceae bacterium]|nr:cytochrome c3 family protein [Desulfuromonadaceae bacterium]